MELRDALDQIAEIRQQMARSELFRGYRSATVAFSGVVAFTAALLQSSVAPTPHLNIQPYLLLWLSAAALSTVVIGIEMFLRGRRSPAQARVTLLAVELFFPCLVAGAALTWVLMRHAPQSLWMLPGLWAILFSLGSYASCRVLPKPLFCAACYYLLAGCLCLVFAQGESAFSPWAMGLTFGLGQLLTAALLYWTLERRHET